MDSTDLYKNPSYTGRVEYYWDKKKRKKNCTLKLTDVKMTDSTGYNLDIITDKQIWFGQSAVELSITGDNQPSTRYDISTYISSNIHFTT